MHTLGSNIVVGGGSTSPDATQTQDSAQVGEDAATIFTTDGHLHLPVSGIPVLPDTQV